MSNPIQVIIDYEKHQKFIKDYFYVAAVALLVYDYFLTLHLEIQLIWFSKWTYTKVVFLLVRYMPFVFTAILLQIQVAVDISPSTCSTVLPIAVWMLQIDMMLSESILAVRTWAIWHRNRFVGVGLALVTATFIAVGCIMVNTFIHNLNYTPGLYPGFRGCLLTGNIQASVWQNYGVIAIAQAIFLMLVATRAFMAYRTSNNNVLAHVIYRDGILFYIYLLCVSLGNVIVVLTVPPDMMTILGPLEGVTYSVLITRTILNIRAVATSGRSPTTELHNGYAPQAPLPQALDSIRSKYSQEQTILSQSSA